MSERENDKSTNTKSFMQLRYYGKSATETSKFGSRCKAVIHYCEHFCGYTSESIETVYAAVFKKRLQTIAESARILSVISQWILSKDFNMHWVCYLIVPHMLNEYQSADEIRRVSCAELHDMAKTGFQKYTLSQKNICTQKKSSYNHETRQECSLVRDMQMIKISKPMRQG
ncbi:hypothetical protein TNCV_4373411 [Trichonephila clavipes]|uniref:Uncharacterized protein n=1 Tax=Trichonephila clavipes TaxID=2585209 RepID=A0A8X6R9U7_TRICX|nr:hypothetical protein TNCV_4373411 [Trichonephila clavipes]